MTKLTTKMKGKDELLELFSELSISAHTVEHPEVFTVDQALPYTAGLPGVFAKNLFLKDKRKSLWLFCAPHDLDIKLNDLARLVSAPGGFRFADETSLTNVLGVKQGAVTLFGLVNDINHQVKLILDESFWEETKADGGMGKARFEDDGIHVMEGVNKDQVMKGDKISSSEAVTVVGQTSQRRVYFHPLVNSASTGITLSELKQFLTYTGHEPIVVKCLPKKT